MDKCSYKNHVVWHLQSCLWIWIQQQWSKDHFGALDIQTSSNPIISCFSMDKEISHILNEGQYYYGKHYIDYDGGRSIVSFESDKEIERSSSGSRRQQLQQPVRRWRPDRCGRCRCCRSPQTTSGG
ncbi:unnamed protein product [Meganyctiphanes norvegica]|uniref:Uncharacterized protein n=1 Tax=Meganyctiphanes norvegica TaxID=48144 RepID=A0AAV2RA62_MEGNR